MTDSQRLSVFGLANRTGVLIYYFYARIISSDKLPVTYPSLSSKNPMLNEIDLISHACVLLTT